MEQTMTCAPGTIVRAVAGRDAGRFFVVTAVEGRDLLLADGQRRKLAHPKRKNPVHVQKTAQALDLAGMNDSRLRKALAPMQPQKPDGTRLNDSSRKEVIDDVETGCH